MDVLRCIALFVFSVSMVVTSTSVFAQNTSSEPHKEFLMAATYGTLAGTLIGAASLAFVDRPGENLNKVARGASLGLYLGILLGAYVVYVVPSLEPDPYSHPYLSSSLQVNPLSDLDGRLDGAEVRLSLFSF